MNEKEEKRIDPSVSLGEIITQRLSGTQERYYKNGQLMERCTYKDGEKDGLNEEWHKNGQLAKRSNYKEDYPDGLWEEWYPNGQLHRRGHYKDGYADGIWEVWYDNGQLMERSCFVDGELDGLCESWYDNGQLERRSAYSNDWEFGTREEWNYYSQSVMRFICKHGISMQRGNISNFTPREEYLRLHNLNPDGTRKQVTNKLEETKQVTPPKKKGGIKR